MNSVVSTYSEPLAHGPSMPRRAHRAASPELANREKPLLARLRQGDERAFDDLVTAHHGTMVRMAMGHVADREVAEEVVQDTWMAVIGSLDRFEGRSSLRTWIFGILIHRAKDRGVREKRHTTFSAFESFDDENQEVMDPSRFQGTGERAGSWACTPQPWDDQTPEKRLTSRQAVQAMNQAIDALPQTLTDVLVLRDVEGM